MCCSFFMDAPNQPRQSVCHANSRHRQTFNTFIYHYYHHYKRRSYTERGLGFHEIGRVCTGPSCLLAGQGLQLPCLCPPLHPRAILAPCHPRSLSVTNATKYKLYTDTNTSKHKYKQHTKCIIYLQALTLIWWWQLHLRGCVVFLIEFEFGVWK